MVRLNIEEAKRAQSIGSLQHRILTMIHEINDKNMKPATRVNLCWGLTEEVMQIGCGPRILWTDYDSERGEMHHMTISKISRGKLKAHLQEFSMASYLRALYCALFAPKDDDSEIQITYDSHHSRFI
ncbi:MAG: hypothetical protein AABX75_01725 [Nanoarchaeota archaeon]